MSRKLIWLLVALVLAGAASIMPAAAQTLRDDAAYQELLRLSEPSNIVVVGGKRYVRAPLGAAGLPGGYTIGGFTRTKVRLPNGQEVEVIDPTKTLTISKGKPTVPVAELPDRLRRIIAELQKLGLDPKIEFLPQALGGHRIDVEIGAEKPGATHTSLIIQLGAPEKVQQVYKASADFAQALIGSWGHAADPVKVPGWTGLVVYATENPKFTGWLAKIGADNYQFGKVLGGCIKQDAMVTVIQDHYDTETWTQLQAPLKRPTTSAEIEAYQKEWERLRRERSLQLAPGLKQQVVSWITILTKIVDDADKPIAPVAAAKPPEAKPPVKPPTLPPRTPVKPPATTLPVKPPTTTKPVTPPTTRPTVEEMFKPPPKPTLGQRLQNWWTQKEDRAAANPAQWRGTAMTHGGALIAGLGVLSGVPGWVAVGVAFFAGGIGAYHSGQPSALPPEHPLVREAREKLQQYQEEWKRGFTKAELEDLGIFLERLDKLTPEQRAQAYRDADIEFTSRAEAFRQMREAEERERKGQ